MAVYEVRTKVYCWDSVLDDAVVVRYDEYTDAINNLTCTIDMVESAGGIVLTVGMDCNQYFYNGKKYIQYIVEL